MGVYYESPCATKAPPSVFVLPLHKNRDSSAPNRMLLRFVCIIKPPGLLWMMVRLAAWGFRKERNYIWDCFQENQKSTWKKLRKIK